MISLRKQLRAEQSVFSHRESDEPLYIHTIRLEKDFEVSIKKL